MEPEDGDAVEPTSSVAPEPSPPRTERTQARIQEARERAFEAWKRVEDARPRVPAVDAAFRAYESDRDLAGSLLAGALAFRLFLFLLPAALVIVSVLALFGRANEEATVETAARLGLSTYVTRSVAAAAQQSATGTVVLLGIGLVGLYFASIAAAKALRIVHMLAWGEKVRPMRQAWKGGAWFFAWSLLAIGSSSLANYLRSASGPGIVAVLLVVFVFAGAWFAASYLLPHADVPWTALVPGAVLVGAGFQVLHLVTVLYLSRRLASSSEVYGALGVAAVLLLWLYLIGRLMVGSAVLNATLWRRKHAGAREGA